MLTGALKQLGTYSESDLSFAARQQAVEYLVTGFLRSMLGKEIYRADPSTVMTRFSEEGIKGLDEAGSPKAEFLKAANGIQQQIIANLEKAFFDSTAINTLLPP